MRIKKNNSSKKKILIIVAAVIICGFATAVYAYQLGNPGTDNTESAKNESSDKQQATDLQKDPEGKQEASNSDKPATPTESSTSSKKQVQMTTSTNTSGGTVFIRGGINYPVMGGNCYAQLTGPSGQSIRKDTIVLQNPASTDCKTISIPISELSSGAWSYTLNYTSDDYEGVSNEISFTL